MSAFQHAPASPPLVSTAAAPPSQHAASLQSAARQPVSKDLHTLQADMLKC